VSEVPSASSDIEISYAGSQRANSLVQLTNDLGIDQYMAAQDQGGGQATSSHNLLPHEKLSIINTLKQKEMTEGETWFIISHPWYRKWEQACLGKPDKKGVQLDETSIGPIDNSDIADSDGNIIVSPAEGLNVDYIPEQAWEHFLQW
jgi:ubiquitin carboxyl-terminal hydrolase 4/11/15